MFNQLDYDKEKLRTKKATIDLGMYTDNDIVQARNLNVTLKIYKPN